LLAALFAVITNVTALLALFSGTLFGAKIL
jgi:hypothetical protein